MSVTPQEIRARHLQDQMRAAAAELRPELESLHRRDPRACELTRRDRLLLSFCLNYVLGDIHMNAADALVP